MLNDFIEYDKMNDTESKLWWYRILHDQVITILKKKFDSKNISILDAACGTGGLMEVLTEAGFNHISGFDVSDYAASLARKKTGKEINVLNLKEADLVYDLHSFDVIICNDALYFIGEDQLPLVLKQLWSLLKKDGVFMINLPAFQCFKGMHDVSVGIQKRWTYRRFRCIAKDVFFDASLIKHFYWPFLLAPLILAARVLQRLQLKRKPDRKVVSDVQLPPSVINNIFYNITKCESCLPFSRWFGSSIFIAIYR